MTAAIPNGVWRHNSFRFRPKQLVWLREPLCDCVCKRLF